MRALKLTHYVALAGVLAVTTFGGYFAYERLAPRPAAAARVTTVDVARGPITSSVSATGSIASPAQSKLGFKTGGRLLQLLVGVGEEVAEGQPLARIDDADLQVALAQAQANLRSAEAKLEQTRAGSKPEDLAAAQAQVDAARIKVEQARTVPTGPEMAAAQSQLEAARIKLGQVLSGSRAEDVAAAQAQVEAAAARLAALLDPRPEDLAAAQSQVEAARIKLAQIQQPRPEDVRNAELAVAAARTKLQSLQSPRPEDLAAAQSALDQQRTKLAQLVDMPRTAKPEDIANAELAVRNAQVAVDKARAEAANAGRAGSSLSQAAAEASVQQALISLQTAQNNLSKLQQQGPSEWEIRLQQQAVEQAQASLNKLRSPSPADVAAAQTALEQAEIQLQKIKSPAALDLQAAQEAVNQAEANLAKLRTPSPAEVAGAQQAVLQAQASLEKLLSPADFEIQAAQQAVVQAQASVDKLLNGNAFDVRTALTSLAQVQASFDLKRSGPSVQDILVATAAVEQAQAQVKQAEANLAAATLAAPYAGHVAALGANLGEQVGAGTAVVTLVDTRQVRADVVVDETDVAKIQPGQPVRLTLEALPGQTIPGRVAMVAPVATVQQGVVNYAVHIQVDPSQARGARPGMTATANIVTASKDDALLAPNRAIRTQGRNRTVEVVQPDGKTRSVPVAVGLSNEQFTEVLSGLQPGDRVVIPSTTAARVTGIGGGPGGFGGPGGGVGGPGPNVVVRQGG